MSNVVPSVTSDQFLNSGGLPSRPYAYGTNGFSYDNYTVLGPSDEAFPSHKYVSPTNHSNGFSTNHANGSPTNHANVPPTNHCNVPSTNHA